MVLKAPKHPYVIYKCSLIYVLHISCINFNLLHTKVKRNLAEFKPMCSDFFTVTLLHLSTQTLLMFEWSKIEKTQMAVVLKFIYSEKATKFCNISTVDLSYVVTVKPTVEISQNFVAFSEYMNFNK